MKVDDCFEAGGWGYVAEASILNPLRDLRFPETGKVLFKIDTGFYGPTLVTSDVFEFLGLEEIEVPDDLRPTYTTLAGPLTMRSAPAVLQIKEKQLETDILTPLLGPSRMLLGFRILKELNLALLGKRTCFVRVMN